MAEIVNLRLARKAKARATAGDSATQNRAKFGRTKAERAEAASEIARLHRRLNGAKHEE
jgi:hypothetical protein